MSEQSTPESARPTPAPLGFAVIGAGVIADVIADAIADVDDAQLRLVVARNPQTGPALAEKHAARWSADLLGWASGPDADDIDVAVVATPSGAHADPAVAALEAGKHVLIEKPLEITLEAADRIIAAERRSGRVVGVISQHRFDHASRQVFEAIRSGQLGRLTSASASCAWWRPQAYYDSAAWRGTKAVDGGGAAMNQGIHVIDLMLAMMGDPVEVSAYTALLAHERIDVEDIAVAVVRFGGGALGTIHVTTAAYPGVDTGLRIYGDRGSAVIADDELVFMQTADSDDDIHIVDSHARPLGYAHRLQIADMARAVRAHQSGDRTARPAVGTREARQALELILGMYESAQSGRPVALG
ncbi:Gfo/Idh/MocA family protein [Mycolicibacterium thermoresistibile]